MTVDERARADERYVRTGPGTLAGRYLRAYWQPVFHAADLPAGRATPLKILGEAFTLYRGTDGLPVLTEARCPHRQAQLSTGWVEGASLRCFYHGWRFGADGSCLEQPAEDDGFARKVSLRVYPLREYLGLIFAYLGDDEPPAFPRYPAFERFHGFVEIDSYERACNYFQNLENALDMSHVAFVHSDNAASFRRIGHGLELEALESSWGVTYTYTRPDGERRVQQFGMPNVFYMTALPTDAEIGWQESLFWWVPVDDERHVQFSVHRVPATGAAAERIRVRREARRGEIDQRHQDVCEAILAGETTLAEIDRSRVDLVRLQDDIAQIGQGALVDRSRDRLGRGDIGVIAIRKRWERELRAFEGGAPPTDWRRDAELVPRAWSLHGAAADASDVPPPGADAPVVDVRPHIEVDALLRVLRGRRP